MSLSDRARVQHGVNPVTLHSKDDGGDNVVLGRIHIKVGDDLLKTVSVMASSDAEMKAANEGDPMLNHEFTPKAFARLEEDHFISGMRHLFPNGELDSDRAVDLADAFIDWWEGFDDNDAKGTPAEDAEEVVAMAYSYLDQRCNPEPRAVRFAWELAIHSVQMSPLDRHKTIRLPHPIQDVFVKITAWHDEEATMPLCVQETDEPADYEPLVAQLELGLDHDPRESQ